MNFSSSHLSPNQRNEEPRSPVALTPEELRVLKECMNEGIYKKGIPWGTMSGFIAYVLAKNGLFKHGRYGVKPAVIGFGLMGYFVGRYTYAKICFERLLEIPDGNLRKSLNMAPLIERENAPPDAYYATVEPSKDQWDSRSPSSDIDVTPTSSFDTVPSDYYNQKEDETTDSTIRNYTSYDDLRRENRNKFNKFYNNPSPSSVRPEEKIVIRRPTEQETKPSDFGKKNKYGDSWE